MARKLIVCCDGTWNFADQPRTTNVTKVALAARTEADGAAQRVYYGSGVGLRPWQRWRGGAFGMGLSSNVQDAYRFLVDTYEPGDELFLFGFSRGAFTARSLAGLVRNSGILRRESAHRVKEAWALYRDRAEKPTSTASKLFRGAHAHETGIHFIGVWDTVGALGIPTGAPFNRRWAFHDTELSSWIKGAFHALAVDEQRAPFTPTLWHQQPGAAKSGQELKQVWFSGVHCDVGGGYEKTGLSDIALLWMVQQARRYGLEFKKEAFGELEPDSMGELHDSLTGLNRLMGQLHRPVGRAANGCEYLSNTATERYSNDADYRPPELQGRTQGKIPVEQVPLTFSEGATRDTGKRRAA